MRVLILGATGLLGNTLFRLLSQSTNLEVFGTIRNISNVKYFITSIIKNLVTVENLEDIHSLERLLDIYEPDLVINCTSLSRSEDANLGRLIQIYSLFPQLLSKLCRLREIRMIQISSDGVFSGNRGCYTENDIPDAVDPYGIAKILGEIHDTHVFTMRTSILGPELSQGCGLLSWFLAQKEECRCFTQAIFSGLTTLVVAQIIRDIIIPNAYLYGVFNVSADPISKFDLLDIVRRQYGKQIQMIPDDSVIIDRSLCPERFRLATGYIAPSWQEMIESMHAFNFGLRKI